MIKNARKRLLKHGLDKGGQLSPSKRLLDRARKRGARALVDAVEFFIATFRDPDAAMADRMRAAENLCDRYGHPRLPPTDTAAAEAYEIPKLIIRRTFAAPDTFRMPPTIICPPPIAMEGTWLHG